MIIPTHIADNCGEGCLLLVMTEAILFLRLCPEEGLYLPAEPSEFWQHPVVRRADCIARLMLFTANTNALLFGAN